MRCLILDDDPGVRRAIAMCVRREGHEVVEAASALEAIALVNGEQTFDFALLDWNLGTPLTGSSVARACLRRSIPWAMVSAWSRDDILESWKAQNPLAGMIEFVEKPIGDGEALRNVLSRIERSRDVTPPHGMRLPKP